MAHDRMVTGARTWVLIGDQMRICASSVKGTEGDIKCSVYPQECAAQQVQPGMVPGSHCFFPHLEIVPLSWSQVYKLESS